MIYRILESIVPVRKEPSHRSEQIDELLYGYRFRIVELENDWLRIQTVDYPYEGWISAKTSYEEEKVNEKKGILWSLTGTVNRKLSKQTILLGSIVHLSEIENGECIEPSILKNVADIASRFMYAPYRWGGKNIFGVDCSGLVQLVFSFIGYWLPRDAWQQAQHGEVVFFPQEACPGDLAFFEDHEHRIVHVGIIISSNQIIHASGQVRVDFWDQEGIFHSERKIYTHRLKVIKRLI
ncbi:MAG: C40 family peptidase [Bacteroidales bacterium]|nr:C40 family peptidase [Bacteroidales bacterium]